jgi:uncharacterized protein (TIGR04222 family)
MTRWSLVLGLALAGAAAPAQAQERALALQRFHAAIGIDPDGSIEVAESLTVRFTGSWNGVFRTIPVKYRTPQGFNWSIRLDRVSASDEEGNPLRVEPSRERHYLKYRIWVPNARDAVRSVVFRYRAREALRFFDAHDELYWNVTGDEWEIPIESAAATIRLPGGAEGVRAIAFNGPYGSTDRDAEVTTDAETVRITLAQPLGYQEGLTAVVGWNRGLVARPTATDRATGFLASNWPLALPIPVLVAMFAIWRRRGRDPARRPITTQYEPPAGLSPAEAGTLLDHSADMRDVTATLVDLAVRGFLKIEERRDRKLFGLITDQDFVFHRLQPNAESGLKLHERAVLAGLFEPAGNAPMVKLSDLEDEFYRHLSGIKEGIFEGLGKLHYYRSRPDRVRAGWVAAGIAVGVLIGAGGAVLADRWSLTPVPFLVAAVLSAAIVIGFGLVMPARTEAGTRALERILGFEEFLQRVEGDRLRDFVKTPEMFERYLPFAMAFGVEKKWAKAFEGIYTEPPRWYVGAHSTGFHLAGFSDRLSAMSHQAATTMASSPRSSSGSGFGGGGSSGGGGGGGGGGGF